MRLKICCLQDEAELTVAIRHGADLVGFVGRGLSGPEVIDDDDRIGALADLVPPGVVSVLLTRLSEPGALVDQIRRTRVAAVQLCDFAPEAAWEAVREAFPAVRILQVVHVSGPEALDEATRVAPHVDALLLDSGTPTGPNPVYGGSGRTHDWAISARIVASVDKPVFLAGGLNADNVASAVSTVRPFGLDLCSGVRTGGRLDPDKLGAYVRAARS